MRIIIRPGHARNRMAERNVTEEDIRAVLDNYHSSWSTPRGGIQYEGIAPNGQTLKVWLLPPGYLNPDTTVTLMSVAWKD